MSHYSIKLHAFGKKLIALQKYPYELVLKAIPMVSITRINKFRFFKQIELHYLQTLHTIVNNENHYAILFGVIVVAFFKQSLKNLNTYKYIFFQK